MENLRRHARRQTALAFPIDMPPFPFYDRFTLSFKPSRYHQDAFGWFWLAVFGITVLSPQLAQVLLLLLYTALSGYASPFLFWFRLIISRRRLFISLGWRYATIAWRAPVQNLLAAFRFHGMQAPDLSECQRSSAISHGRMDARARRAIFAACLFRLLRSYRGPLCAYAKMIARTLLRAIYIHYASISLAGCRRQRAAHATADTAYFFASISTPHW